MSGQHIFTTANLPGRDNIGAIQQCVLCFGVEDSAQADHPVRPRRFSNGFSAIRASLARHRFNGDFLTWKDEYPKGCPSHHVIPFAFKPYCIREAMQRGYHLVLWLDASIRIKRDPAPLFELIGADGYLFFENYHSVGEFCKDEALGPLGIARDESFSLPSCDASVIGLDLRTAKACEFLEQWVRFANDGITFPGPKWSGVKNWPATASADSRVKGHRHDQTCASVIALKLGMSRWKSRAVFDDFFSHRRDLTERPYRARWLQFVRWLRS